MVSLLISWKGKRCSGTIFHIDASWISRASHDPLLFDPCISSVHWGAKLEPGDHKLWFCSPSYWQGDWMSSCQREGHEKKAFTCSVFHHQGDLRFCLINLAVITPKSDYAGCRMADWHQVFSSFFLMEVRLKMSKMRNAVTTSVYQQ